MIGLWNLAAADPDRIAVVEADTGRSATRGELARRTNQVVHALRELGLGHGSVVGVVLDNEIAHLEVFFAGLQAGWYVVPINYHFTEDEIAFILNDSDAEAVVCSRDHADVVSAAADRTEIPRNARLCVGGHPAFDDYDAVIGAASGELPDDRTAGWMMTYTSGTTGSPKGIKRTLNGMNPDDVGEVWSLPMRIFGIDGEDHVHLVQSPIYHTAVLVYLNASAQFGHEIVLMRTWDAEQALQLIEQYGVTTSHMVPTHFHRMLQLPAGVREKYDLSSIQYAIHGAAPCPVETKRAMIDWFGPVIYEYYGASEGGGTQVGSEDWLARPGTVGQAWPGAEVRILGPDGEEMSRGEQGEVWMKAGALDFEYHKNAERTATSKRDGFFTVGDVGIMDEDGYLFLQGRSSDIIISGGVNVHPSEIESVLIQHDAVADVAVFGIPDPEWGEQIKSVVELTAGTVGDDALIADLVSFCRGHLAAYKVPRSIDVTEALPRDPNGKLYKRLLRDPYWAAANG